MPSIQTVARDYLDLGLDAIPLQTLSKRALLAGWNKLSPTVQWESASNDNNIGFRCGGELSLAVLDSDDKKKPTWPSVVNFLWGFGLEPGSYPVITTPTGGKHVYLSLIGHIDGDYRNIQPDFGAGEFRYGPGSLVVAPPSEIPVGSYILSHGDLRSLPRIKVTDILPILSNKAINAGREARTSRKPSRRAIALLRGKGVDSFPSRSEAEQAILSSLANLDFDFSDVLELFLNFPAAGKFNELYSKNPRGAVRWLKGSYQKALDFVSTHETPAKQSARMLLHWALSNPWPGRTGSSDRAVYLAHISIALRSAKLTYSAGSRELAELAGVSRQTTEKANMRLCANNMLSLETHSIAQLSHVYRLILHNCTTPYRECEGVDKGCNLINQDVFRHTGLGKSAGEVYAALLESPGQTLSELAKRTGRNPVTVWRALTKMSRMVDFETGELLPMVEKDGEKWKALLVDLEQMAHIVGTEGALERQKALHHQERAAHKRGLELTKPEEDKN